MDRDGFEAEGGGGADFELGVDLGGELTGGLAVGSDTGSAALAVVVVAEIPDFAAEVALDLADAERGGLLLECCHELKLIVDLIYQGGLNYMRYSVSDTAEHGDYTGGPKIVTDETRRAMQQMLEDIQSGRYAAGWIAENEAGRPTFNKLREGDRSHPIEQVGARLRQMMPFLKPVAAEDTVGASR